ncbi:hypothetical protein HMPREF3216_00565 [Gardnerella vaginalis]|uniref:Uncharacterized protein n=1 Tax=Gardnerella vaginalis TaxID=2702 RepID=A0A133NPQ6_GARVA|nr:hypothetical protein HMPREF3216_00565 [Gardnerella vaginalis]
MLCVYCANGDCTIFPDFVRDLGQIWYKMRRLFPLFVRDLGQIWYKMRKIFPRM